jgi:dihydroneopterin aldolase
VSFAGTSPKDDRIDEVVDYDFVRAVVHARVAQGHVNLQETLCDDILVFSCIVVHIFTFKSV